MDLVILAAGMGSRFGGLKQIESIDEFNNFIIDYSIYDAIKCKFDKIIFVIKKENYKTFSKTIGKRVSKFIDVDYAFQNNENIEKIVDIPQEREKPFGTAHALLCCKEKVSDMFVVINSDDFYGRKAFKTLIKFAKSNKKDNEFAMCGYKIKNTISTWGKVKRGVCYKKNSELAKINECYVWKENNKIFACQIENSNEKKKLSPNTIVSMNMFLFNKSIFDLLEKDMFTFLKSNESNLLDCEFLLTNVIQNCIEQKIIKVKILNCNEKWLGLTYKEDKAKVVERLAKLRKNKTYPKDLWKDDNLKINK